MRVLSKKTARKYAHLPLHAEPTGLETVRQLRPSASAEGKGARQRLGRLNTAELGSAYNGASGSVVVTLASGHKEERDIRPIEENYTRKVQISKKEQKEGVDLKYKILAHRFRKYFMRKEDIAVLKAIAELLVVQQVHPKELIGLNPYENSDYKDFWVKWCMMVVNYEK